MRLVSLISIIHQIEAATSNMAASISTVSVGNISHYFHHLYILELKCFMFYFVSAIMDNPGEEPSKVKTADGFDIPLPPEFKKQKLSDPNAASSSSCVREAETNPED